MASMDPKQLHDVAKQIAKAADSGDPPSTLLNILAPLENFKATEDLLRQSKIGVAVTKLRQNKDPKVSETATRLVNRWKQEVQAKKKRQDGSPVPGNKSLNGAANGRSSGTSSPAPQGSKSEVKKEPAAAPRQSKVAPEKRNAAADGVDLKITGDATRDACLKLMYDGIVFMSTESPDTVLKVARKVEVAAFEHYKQDTGAEYKTKMRSLFQNLKMKQNTLLRKNVLSEDIPPKKFGK
jgi:transcription elongation factor S-II